MSSRLVELFDDEIFAFRKFRTTRAIEFEINSGIILIRLFINIYLVDIEKI